MISILIIEDEAPAAKRLLKMINETAPGIVLLETLHSVEDSITWLQQNDPPDLIFSDIQLSDGISFNIFKNTPVQSPIIFTTAYDQYAIDAFKLNSIDYLLKPVKKNELAAAIEKYKKTQASLPAPALDIEKLLQSYGTHKPTYKKRFVVRYGEHINSINAEDIAYFYTEDKINFIITFQNRRYTIDYNLDTLESALDPVNFFRINRQFIISIKAIDEMFAYSKSRVLIKLNPACKHETIVSAARSAQFKLWLDDSNEA